MNCSYCGGSRDTLEKISGRQVPVFRPVDDVIHSIEGALTAGYNALNICFDPFPKKYEYWVNLFEKVREKQIQIDVFFESWGVPAPEFIDAFSQTFKGKRSGIAISVESGSETVRCLNKGILYNNEQLFKTLDYLKEKKVTTYIYFTLGLPHETQKDVDETKRLVAKIRKNYSKIVRELLLVPIQIEPGSPMFEKPEKYKIQTNRSCFMDFYHSHGSFESNPYTDLCYTSNTYKETTCSINQFSAHILDRRCKDFCIAAPRILGRTAPGLGKTICWLRHKFWKRKGFGAIPAVRAHFN